MRRKKRVKKKKKVSYNQRRAEILKLIRLAGHPRVISQSKLAKEFGVSQPQIHEDFKFIKKQIKDALPKDVEFITDTVYNKAIVDLIQGSNKEKYMAAKLVKDWNDWLFDIGVQQKAIEPRAEVAAESNVTINFNNIYLEFKQVVFKVLKKYPKILQEIKDELEEE